MTTMTEQTTTTNTWTTELPTWAVDLMADKVAKANRKAARNTLGTPFTMTVDEIVERHRKVGGVTVTDRWAVVRITVTGATSLPGWGYAAKVDWSLGQPVLNVSPLYTGGTLPRPESKRCDHCDTVRSRNETHLVTGPVGAVRQVGSSCLTAYTGIPVGWVQTLFDLADSEDDGWGGYGNAERTYPVRLTLLLAIAIIDAVGFVSRSKSDEIGQVATVDRFQVMADGARNEADRRLADATRDAMERRSRSDADLEAEVDAIIAWAAGLGDGSEYLSNLRVIVGDAEQELSRRHLGFAVSAVASFRRERERTAQRNAERADRKPLVAGRQTLTGEITTVRETESQFGTQTKMRLLLDGHGGSSVWGTLPRAVSEAVPGTRVEMVATVEVSSGDPTFGFFARPTRARIIG